MFWELCKLIYVKKKLDAAALASVEALSKHFHQCHYHDFILPWEIPSEDYHNKDTGKLSSKRIP